MPRIPYERIATVADDLYDKMTAAKDIKTLRYWYDAYVSVLQAAGWDPISYDKETQRRIDEGWEDTKPITWN